MSLAYSSFSLASSRECLVAIEFFESKYSIPKNLLKAIATVESGRLDKASNTYGPWPWAVSVQGSPYYFESQIEAIAFVKKQLNMGVKNIDVGCNQINLQHHGHNFQSVEHAFNPIMNSKYAAEFLKSHFTTSKSWITAVSRYHSHTPTLGKAYSEKVMNAWSKNSSLTSHLVKASSSSSNKEKFLTQTIRSKNRSHSKLNEPIIVFSRVDNINNSKIVEVSERMLKKH